MKSITANITKTTRFRTAALAVLTATSTLFCPTPGLAAPPTTVYAGSILGLFKSTNGGQTWTNIFNIGPATAVAIDPTNPQTIYVGDGGAIYKSTDGGNHWHNMSNGLPTGPVANIDTIAINPSDTSIIYAGSGDEFQGSLFKSTNAAASWTNIGGNIILPPPPPPSQGSAPLLDIFTVAIDPVHTRTLYLTGQTGTPTYKSTNGGTTWTAMDVTGGAGTAIAINPANDLNVYVSGPFGLSETTDGGNTWTPFLTPPQIGQIVVANGLAIDPSNPGTVYVGAESTIYKSPSFAAYATLATPQINGLIVDPANPNILYASAVDGVYMSNQGGAQGSWNLVLSSKFTAALAMEPNAAQAAFFNLAESAVEQLIAEIQSTPNPAFTCNLLQSLENEISTFVQWGVLSSAQGQQLTKQIQPVLQSAPCR